MRMMLQAVKDGSGVQYGRLLLKAGLKQYLYEMPADSWRPTGTEEELTQLFATVYELLGEPLTRLFLLNYGLLLAPRVFNSDKARPLASGTATVPQAPRAGVFVRTDGHSREGVGGVLWRETCKTGEKRGGCARAQAVPAD